MNRFWISVCGAAFGFWIGSLNSLSLWERARVRVKFVFATLTSIPPREGEEVNFEGRMRVVKGVDRE